MSEYGKLLNGNGKKKDIVMDWLYIETGTKQRYIMPTWFIDGVLIKKSANKIIKNSFESFKRWRFIQTVVKL